jgi:hypothetical protein
MFGTTNWRSSPYGVPIGVRVRFGPRIVPPPMPTMMQAIFGVGLQQLLPRPSCGLGPRIVLPPTQTMLQASCGAGLQQLPPRPKVITPPNVIYCYEAQGAPIVMDEIEKPLALQDCLADDSAEPVQAVDGQESPGDELNEDDDDSSIISGCTAFADDLCPLKSSPGYSSLQEDVEEGALSQDDELVRRFEDIFDKKIESMQPLSPLAEEDARELAGWLHASLAAIGTEAGDPVDKAEIDAWVDLAFRQDAAEPLEEGCL